MCWGLLGISRWFGICKSETKAPGLAQLEPRFWVLGFLVVGWIEEIAATERQTCLLPIVCHSPSPNWPCFWVLPHTLADFYFTAGANHTSKPGELEWKTVLKLWTDGIGIFSPNECVATPKQHGFRCQQVMGQGQWVLGTRAAGSADTERSCCTLGCAVCGSYFCINIQIKKKKALLTKQWPVLFISAVRLR